MDNIIDELINDYKLSDYEALIVTGIFGIHAIENANMDDIYSRLDDKLKPIINKILNK